MENELNNSVSVTGSYNSIPTSVTSNASVVTMIDGLSVSKSADKQVWADGELTYTIVLKNDTDKTYGTPVITDILDGTLINFVNDSVVIDGVKAETSKYNYNEDTNTLTINLDDIASSGSTTIEFKVTKK